MFGEAANGSRDEKHRSAVVRSLRAASDAARRGNFVDALARLDAVQAIGDELPTPYDGKHRAWLRQLESQRSHGG